MRNRDTNQFTVTVHVTGLGGCEVPDDDALMVNVAVLPAEQLMGALWLVALKGLERVCSSNVLKHR